MHPICAPVSDCLYCASSVVGSEVWLSSTEPKARYAGQPSLQPFATASFGPPTTGVDGPCSRSTYRFVPLPTLPKAEVRLGCSKVSGARLNTCWLPTGAPVAPSLSVAMICVDENCDALTTPRLPR